MLFDILTWVFCLFFCLFGWEDICLLDICQIYIHAVVAPVRCGGIIDLIHGFSKSS